MHWDNQERLDRIAHRSGRFGLKNIDHAASAQLGLALVSRRLPKRKKTTTRQPSEEGSEEMALVTGPLLSMRASGKIGKAIVFSKWKGRQTARQYVIPANPKSSAQTQVRTTFQWVHDLYKNLQADAQQAWILKAAQMQITGMNAFTGVNVPLCRSSTDAHEVEFITDVNGGIAAGPPSLTPGAGQIAATLTAPSLPTGWTINKAIFICLKSVDPHGELEVMPITETDDTTSPYAATFTGLTASHLYIVGAAFQYQKNPSTLAYGVSSNATATPT